MDRGLLPSLISVEAGLYLLPVDLCVIAGVMYPPRGEPCVSHTRLWFFSNSVPKEPTTMKRIRKLVCPSKKTKIVFRLTTPPDSRSLKSTGTGRNLQAEGRRRQSPTEQRDSSQNVLDTRTCPGCGTSMAGRTSRTIYCTRHCAHLWAKRVRRVQGRAYRLAGRLGHRIPKYSAMPYEDRKLQRIGCIQCGREFVLEFVAGVKPDVHGNALSATCGSDSLTL